MFTRILQGKASLIVFGTTLGCFLLFTILTIVFTLFTLYNLRQTVFNSEVARLEAVADAHVSEIQLLTSSYRKSAKMVASRTKLRQLFSNESNRSNPANRAAILKIMRDAQRSDPEISSISVIDRAGTIFASTKASLSGLRLGDAPARLGIIPKITNEESVQPIVSRDKISIVAFVPMWLEERHIGVMRVEFIGAAVHRGLRNTHFAETGEVFLGVHDKENNARFVNGARKKNGTIATKIANAGDHSVPMIRALNGESATIVNSAVDYIGTPVLAVTRYIPELKWGLVAKIDKEEVLTRLSMSQTVLASFGAILVIICITTGIVFRRRLVAALLSHTKAEKQFSQLFTSAPSAVLIVDEEKRIALANLEAERLLRYDTDALSGIPAQTVIPEIRQVIDGASAYDPSTDANIAPADQYAVCSDGHKLPIEISLTAIETKDGPMVVVTLIDITERISSQKALEARAELLARSNRELDQFAYVASHDLRAPLRGIDQLAGFIEEDLGDTMPEESRRDLGLLRNRIKRMDDLLSSLLEYSRIGRRESEPEPIDISTLIKEVCELYVPSDRFHVDIPDDTPQIYAPRTAIEIIFRNLVMNAVKHHDAERGNIRIAHYTEDQTLIFTVSDDGPGIPQEYREKVFQLFQTLQSRDQVEGSGMGLSLVKKTMETLGGAVDIVANEGRGTTFRLSWPIENITVRDAA